MILPIYVSETNTLNSHKLSILLMFDACFMLDKIIELFIGVLNSDGKAETKLRNVIMKNFSFGFWLEVIYIVGPLFFDTNALELFLFKIPRFNRLFERDNAIQSFVDYYGAEWTVFEIQNIKSRLEILSFTL